MEHKLIVPTSLNEIPLVQMLEYEQLSNDMDEMDKVLNALSIFCNVSIKDIKNIPMDAINKAIQLLQTTLSEKPKFEPKFELNGVKYGFIPNIDELTTGEFIDIENYQKSKELYKMMSVLYRPVIIEGQGNRDDIMPYDGKVNEEFKMMPCGVAYGATVFFWSLGIDLLNCMKKYLVVNQREQVKNTPLIINGVGLDSSISSLMEILQELTQLRDTPFTKPFFGLVTKQTWQSWKRKQSKKHINDE